MKMSDVIVKGHSSDATLNAIVEFFKSLTLLLVVTKGETPIRPKKKNLYFSSNARALGSNKAIQK